MTRKVRGSLTEKEKQAFLEECCWEGAGIEEMECMAEHVNFFGYDNEPAIKPEEEHEEEQENHPEDYLENCVEDKK